VAAQDIRLGQVSAMLSPTGGSGSSALSVGSGVRHSNSGALSVAVSAGLSVTVSAGFGVVQGSAAANSGTYVGVLDTAATLTCATADPINPRIDAVALVFTDNGNNTSTGVVELVTGTPATVPAIPTLPANALLLATIAVAANATTLSSGNITDKRPFYASVGGIAPALSANTYPATAPTSAYLHNIATGRLLRYNGSAWVAPSVALFAPLSASGSATATSTTFQTIASGPVTTDGNTPVKVYLKFSSISASSNSAGDNCTIQLSRDGTAVDSIVKYAWAAGAHLDGGTIMIPDTPAAGTHTYAWQIANGGSGTFALHVGVMLIEASSP
jgi:hypothetical protein